mgnify:CR=1 FL=1
MALADKKFDDVHNKTGSDKDKLKHEFDAGYLSRIADLPEKEPALSALVYQMGLMQEELIELRRHLINDVGDGAKGDKGDKGDTGATGAAGAAGTTDASKLDASRLPTSNRGLATGKLYNDRGTVKIA